MKPYLLPAATALIGFAIAWIAKPAAPTITAPSNADQATVQVRPTRAGPGTRPDGVHLARPTEVRARDFPLVEQAEQGPKTREQAKMLRLTEALGLSVDQEGSIIQLVKDAAKLVNMDLSAMDEMTLRGNAIQEGLQKVLTPDQYAKFQEIQIRERDNRTELRAQRMLADTIEFIDLSPVQRDQVVNRLRQKAREDLQAIPASATLLFDKTILPTGGGEISPEGVILLTQMGEKIKLKNPLELQTEVMNRHKEELEETLKCFDGILTPAQMGQYTASLAEKQATMDRFRADVAKRAPSLLPDPTLGDPASETPK